ncbi:MAG: formylglycine-generating enzyme family protein [Elusimicrobia bacterium]|nr:formylglycine-generating enzyme family protein [Elusimicrobiota bacterium]
MPRTLSKAVMAAVFLSVGAGWLWHRQPRWAGTPGPRQAEVVVGKAGIEWVAMPGGSFMMGADDAGADAQPPHRVAIAPFRIARTLVTNQQYQACVAAGACKAPGDCGERFQGDDRPVVNVDWGQAEAFSRWAGGRLPSEAEWEYASRSAGQDWRFPWGNEDASCERAAISDCNIDVTQPVCRRPRGNTAQGLCDMAGNAWEWVRDCYHGSYQGAPTDGSAWETPAVAFRVLRGGSWFSDAAHARSARRSSRAWAYRNCHLGFRPAQDR